MVVNCNIVDRELHKALVDNGRQVDIIFMYAFDSMGINYNFLQQAVNLLYEFGGGLPCP